ncbi:MAG: hypothetical protein U0103_22705 [Candidatus Obscuribacterales bacterium]|nr:hypothetical protein [Cyanobacteria bacterium SZAS LIN-5]RTL44113.1 MAG: hypothetical protein EKK48_07455 [Candidatus Melainabacteria bacterium]
MPVQNPVRNLDLTIETDRNGDHFVVFPRRYENLVAPELHDEKLQWIRSSYDTFLARVREFEELRRPVNYN